MSTMPATQRAFAPGSINPRKRGTMAWGTLPCVLALGLLSACSPIERSRNLADPAVSGHTIAVQVCSTCHGGHGVAGSPNFPNLAAQQPDYLVEQLKAFKAHTRADPDATKYMWGLSKNLTEQQINDIATYFSAQQPAVTKSENTASLEHGKAIFEQGIASTNVPACASCHGAGGEGRQQFPRVAGQHAEYVIKQLEVFKTTDLRPEAALMKTVAQGLSRSDMQSVALYLEAMPAGKALAGDALVSGK